MESKQSLHTAGPSNPACDIRLDLLLGPAAIGSGPGRSKESDTDQSGMERVQSSGYGESSRAGPEPLRCGVIYSHPIHQRVSVSLGTHGA